MIWPLSFENYRLLNGLNNNKRPCSDKKMWRHFALIDLKMSTLAADNFKLEQIAYKNNFCIYQKFKYFHYLIGFLDSTTNDENYRDRSEASVLQLNKDKVVAHLKLTNLIRLFNKKHNSATNCYSLVKENELELAKKYYCQLFAFNSKVIVNLQSEGSNLIHVYDQHLDLISSLSANEPMHVKCLNSEEILYWSSTERYVVLDYMLKKQIINFNLNELSGVLFHLSTERVFCLDTVGCCSVLKIFTRDEFCSLVNTIEINVSQNCIQFDQISRTFIKLANEIVCYDKNGQQLFIINLYGSISFDFFLFIDNFNISLINLNQNKLFLY